MAEKTEKFSLQAIVSCLYLCEKFVQEYIIYNIFFFLHTAAYFDMLLPPVDFKRFLKFWGVSQTLTICYFFFFLTFSVADMEHTQVRLLLMYDLFMRVIHH